MLVYTCYMLEFTSYNMKFTNFVLTSCNLQVKNNIEFPLNTSNYRKYTNVTFTKKENTIPSKKIMEKVNLHYEKILFDKV